MVKENKPSKADQCVATGKGRNHPAQQLKSSHRIETRRKLQIGMAVFIPLVFLLVGCSGIPDKDSSKEELVSSVKGKTFVIGTETSYAPFEFTKDGEFVGIDMDLLRAVAKRQGFEIDIRSLGFDAALQALQSNQVDAVISGMSITQKRKQTFDFSAPYFESGIQLATSKTNTKINSFNDLRGRQIAVKIGTESAAWAEKNKEQYGFGVRMLKSSSEIIDDVRAGHSAALLDDQPALAYAARQGSPIRLVGQRQEAGRYGLAVNKNKNSGLRAAFNEGLRQLRNDGGYNAILTEYLGDSAPLYLRHEEQSVQGKEYKVATDTTYAPFEFRNGSGELVGIDMDLLQAIAEDQKFKINIESLGFNAAVTALQSNQVDAVIAGMSITSDRRRTFDFSQPYFNSGIQLAVKKDGPSPKNLEEIRGKKVAVKQGTQGSAYAESIRSKYNLEVNVLQSSSDMVDAVMAGHVDGVFEDYPVIAYGVAQGNGLQLADIEPFEGGEYGFAVGKGQNPELVEAFNSGLQNLRETGRYDEIIDAYLADGEEGSEGNSFGRLILDSLPVLIHGLAWTLLVTLFALAIAMILGIIFGFLKVSHRIWLRAIATVYVNIFRGTPVLVQAFFFYFGLPAATGLKLDAFTAGVITLGLNAGAYVTEIVRGGIQAVPTGQVEAGRSLGLGYSTTMRKIVLPQAFKFMTPNIINQFIITLKDTSLLTVLGLQELTWQGQQIIARNFQSFQMWLIVGAIYLIVIIALTRVSNFLDKKVNK